jgi:serine/threonine protein kinase
MAGRERNSSREPEHEARDADAPVQQSRIPTEAVPAAEPDLGFVDTSASGDPMASIRPELPPSPPLVEATVELSGLGDRLGDRSHESESEITLEPASQVRARASAETHAGALLRIPVAEAGQGGAGEGGDAETSAYQLIEQIDVGGMGEVWRARQRSLGRPVALKRQRADKKRLHSVAVQFESEARLTGILDHPNIVTVHELGHDQTGRVFYTMKLIEGTPWSEILPSGRRRTGGGELVELELRDHLGILLEVSQALAFAHSRGVIHRDIKPGNVMIGDYGEVQVVDWGLAVAMEALPELGEATTWILDELPRSALVCGTPAYMAPETAKALRGRIGPATDVYLLGAVLFHVLYGRPPHKGRSVKEVITKAKANAWSFPSEISGRLKPWDALLRPVIRRALASEPELRYADAGEFGDALREAIRNYESAKVASRAQEQLAAMDPSTISAGEGYQHLAAMIARLEGALESWPRNLAARQTLAQAHLELAGLALSNGDLSLAKASVAAYEKLPPLPEPEPERLVRRLTLNPVDGTLVGAPRPTDSLVAAGTSDQWVSSAGDLGGGVDVGALSDSGLARTIGAAELARSRVRAAEGTRVRLDARGADGPRRTHSVASVQIHQTSNESMLDEEEQLAARAASLGGEVRQREREFLERRQYLRLTAALVAMLLVAVAGTVVYSQLAVHRERDRARAERDKLSEVLLDETANTVEAQLDVLFEPVHGALLTAVRWAAAGELDVDDPRALNRYYMPLLDSIEAATSTLRADAKGREYMLLSRAGEGWRTRTTLPGAPSQLRDWTQDGELIETWTDERAYDPHDRPWYRGGAALREQARRARLDGNAHPVFWTSPYRFFTTHDLGISVSSPATGPSGREFVLAFDVKLGDITRATLDLPQGIERGQVFVLDEKLRVLGLPRETKGLSPEQRDELLLEPIKTLDAAPISRAAFLEWQRRGRDGPFRFELGEGEDDNFWVGFRHVDKPDRPRLWIGVVVPESHFE